MLVDIFADRYAETPIWHSFGEPEQRLLVQTFRIMSEDVCPYYRDGNEYDYGKRFWTDIQSRLSRELGLTSLSPTTYSYTTTWNGNPHSVVGTYPMVDVCKNWMLQTLNPAVPADRFIKERLSLIEIGFRRRGDELAQAKVSLPTEITRARLEARYPSRIRLPGDIGDGMTAAHSGKERQFELAVEELNTRLRQARTELNYHSGFIQRSGDPLVTTQIETPFWALVSTPEWKNVDIDMKEAFDRRDNGGRDPAFHAMRALESTIKIVSDRNGWTHGKEKGAHNFIDNLTTNGLLSDWESDSLKLLFSKVRNQLGHGPGSTAMPSLTVAQTNWAIGTCITWISSLIRRS